MNETDPLKGPCPICGDNYYTWGDFSAHALRFRSDDGGFFDGMKLVTAMRARRCERCRNVQIFDADNP